MPVLHFGEALLPEGWAKGVAIHHEAGLITRVETGLGAVSNDGPIALPGLASLHSHSFQRGMAGLAERRGPSDDSFWTWREVMYRFLGQITAEDVETIAAFAFMEMLERGFTAVGEFHYLHHQPDGTPYANPGEHAERIASAASETGIALTLLPVFYAHGGFGGQAPHAGQRRFLSDIPSFARLMEASASAIAGLPQARLGFAPHSLRAATPEELEALVAAYPNGPVHIHVAEQLKEVEDCLAWSGQRPVEWLLAHQPVDARWCLIHATHLTPEETLGLARSGAVAGLCPITEANLGDGVFPGVECLANGGRFGVGTDSNVEISAPGELRMLEYSQRLTRRIRNAMSLPGVSTGRALQDAALAGGAQALGRPMGIVPGARADIVTLQADAPDLAGRTGDDRLDSYIFTGGHALIDRVYAAGHCVVDKGRHQQHEALASAYRRVINRLAGII
jgi:formimidoylglutamate deiminase